VTDNHIVNQRPAERLINQPMNEVMVFLNR